MPLLYRQRHDSIGFEPRPEVLGCSGTMSLSRRHLSSGCSGALLVQWADGTKHETGVAACLRQVAVPVTNPSPQPAHDIHATVRRAAATKNRHYKSLASHRTQAVRLLGNSRISVCIYSLAFTKLNKRLSAVLPDSLQPNPLQPWRPCGMLLITIKVWLRAFLGWLDVCHPFGIYKGGPIQALWFSLNTSCFE